MSGFFLTRRTALDLDALRPCGFKVLLEILVCGEPLRATEVAFRFGARHAGTSKASLGEGARYVKRLIELRTAVRRNGRRPRLSPSAYPSPLSELSNR
jgi:dolichol-phosphate mannosyltransferase